LTTFTGRRRHRAWHRRRGLPIPRKLHPGPDCSVPKSRSRLISAPTGSCESHNRRKRCSTTPTRQKDLQRTAFSCKERPFPCLTWGTRRRD